MIELSSRVASDHPEVVVEDHQAEHSLSSEQHLHVAVEGEAPGQHDDGRVEPLDILEELVLPAVVVGNVDDLDTHMADTGVQVVTAIRYRHPLGDLLDVGDPVRLVGNPL